jgi:hypothetical protein
VGMSVTSPATELADPILRRPQRLQRRAGTHDGISP